MRPLPLTGLAAIIVAISFNIPFALLAARFDYPNVLRHPPAAILAAVQAGGEPLLWTWWAFAMCALAQTALAVAFVALPRTPSPSGVSIGAALIGTLAGLTQAMGLLRWTFVVPGIAAHWAASEGAQRLAIEQDFLLLHQFAGVAVGEHLGMLLTAFWIGLLETAESTPAGRWRRALAAFSAALITLGALEGLVGVTSLRIPGIEVAAPLGYALFTGWLIAIGVSRCWPTAAPRYPSSAVLP